MSIALVGYRGTGKTTIALKLARRLGWSSIDTDELIEEDAGRSIASIFESEGEAGFRDRETRVLEAVIERESFVLACGGGIVLRDQNRRLLAGVGTVIWLEAAPETIHQRIVADPATATSRPGLTTAGGIEEIVQLLKQRTGLYRQCADFAIDTEGRTPAQIVDEIITSLPPESANRP